MGGDAHPTGGDVLGGVGLDLAALVGSLRSNAHLCDVATTPLLLRTECEAIVGSLVDDWSEMRVEANSQWPESSHRGVVRREVRRGRQQPVPGGDRGVLATRIGEAIARTNDEQFGFRLVGIEADVQVLRYTGETADHYVPHMDLSPAASLRKLSFSLLLSDPATFGGGDLCFSAPVTDARTQGTLSVFPSYLQHEVTPVTLGTRDAIVGWAIGPSFT
jgi:PKHD-type hydroxylase